MRFLDVLLLLHKSGVEPLHEACCSLGLSLLSFGIWAFHSYVFAGVDDNDNDNNNNNNNNNNNSKQKMGRFHAGL